MNTEKAKKLVALLAEECTSMGDMQAMLRSLFKGTIEQMLEAAEMDEHFGYEKTTCWVIIQGTAAMDTAKRPLRRSWGRLKSRCPVTKTGSLSRK